jgi:hypothetical protein
VLAEIIGGIVMLSAFCVDQNRVRRETMADERPMFHLDVFKIR